MGFVREYLGDVAALVQIDVDRLYIEKQLLKTRNLMFFVGALGIAVISVFILLVGFLFIRPIKQIVMEAREIAEGERKSRLKQRPNDELGELARSLNIMLESLQERRVIIEEYAEKLELKVVERTADLVVTEEKYRKLVENIPLIVYRVLKDGTTEFINSYFTDKLGYTADDVAGDKTFWQDKVCREDGDQHIETIKSCWEEAKGFQIERTVRDKEGRLFTFVDHALPMKDEKGQVKWIDGIMVDITELKRLEEKTLRAEEIRVLGEISERFAHELRNPLATVGGFARRLRDSLPGDNKDQKIAKIIVEEVARLEAILRIILSSIKPITLCVAEVDLSLLLLSLLEELKGEIKSKGIKIIKSLYPDIPKIPGDDDLLKQAFKSLLTHAIISMPENERLSLSVFQEDGYVVIIIKHKMEGLSHEDIEQFFFPRMIGKTRLNTQNLPLSKIIIHRHGGKIDISREKGKVIVLRIELPLMRHI